MKKYKLKEIRKTKEKTQTEIAKVLNTTAQQYYRYETEQRELSAEQIVKLCKYYKVSADYLLGLKDEQ